MSQQTMRGMRLGTQSLETENGVKFEARNSHSYQCGLGHISQLVFSADAEVPQTWECKTCSKEAILLENGEMVTLVDFEEKIPRSHWQMLLERRSRDELEEILQERLDYLKARRAGAKVDF
jgi:hypothetical protein